MLTPQDTFCIESGCGSGPNGQPFTLRHVARRRWRAREGREEPAGRTTNACPRRHGPADLRRSTLLWPPPRPPTTASCSARPSRPAGEAAHPEGGRGRGRMGRQIERERQIPFIFLTHSQEAGKRTRRLIKKNGWNISKTKGAAAGRPRSAPPRPRPLLSCSLTIPNMHHVVTLATCRYPPADHA